MKKLFAITLVAAIAAGTFATVAAQTPSVALFGPADPAQFGPWDDPARHAVVTAGLPCRPCRRLDFCRLEPGTDGPPPCMRAIEVADVLIACDAVLNAGKP